jgi:uncharacterized protein YrrD
MELRKGTTLTTPKGEKAAVVDRDLIDPTAGEVTHIVVRKGFLFREDRVIPVDLLAQSSRGNITVLASSESLENFPLFEEAYYISPDRDKLPARWESVSENPLVYYPPAMIVGAIIKHVNRNIPEDHIAISSDTRVTTSNGVYAGHVQKTFTDSNDRVTHILIAKGIIFSTERLIPLNWVRWIDDKELRLTVPTEIVESVPEYRE